MMSDPLETERQFVEVTNFLGNPVPALEKLEAACRFLEGIADEFALNESYALELCERLPAILSAVRLIGSDPCQGRFMISILASTQKAIPQVGTFDGWSHGLERLRLATALQFAFAGEWESVFGFLPGEDGPLPTRVVFENWLNAAKVQEQGSPLARLREAARASGEHKDQAAAQILEGILDLWIRDNSRPGCAVPVVWRPPAGDFVPGVSATLRRVDVRILGRAPNAHDDVHVDVPVFGAETSPDWFNVPVAAARALLAEQHGPQAAKFFSARIAFEDKQALHQGASANLAIAALFYCSCLRYAGQRRQFAVSPCAALSGDIDATGRVKQVDPTGLRAKIRAAFFSGVEVLVIPRQQLAEAEQEHASLNQTYPRRRLTLMGIGHLREVFFDRRVTHEVHIPMVRYAARQAWKRRLPAATIATVLLLIALASSLYGPLDKNPAGYAFDGDLLYIKNQHDQIIDRIRVGERTVDEATKHQDQDYSLFMRFVTFADVDHDGRNEIIWIQQPMDARGILSVIKCKSVGSDSIRWEFPLRFTVRFPFKPDIVGSEWSTNQILSDDFDRDGIPEIIAVAGFENFFPQLVVRINGQTGVEMNHYLHTGGLNACIPVDLDGDGHKELVLSGINNALGNACIVILDPPIMSGHSPSSEDYSVEGSGPGTERAYLRIPRTVVGSLFASQVKYNQAIQVEVAESSKTLSVHIVDFWLPGQRPEDQLHARLIGHFGFDLVPKSFGTYDDFDLLYDRYTNEKRIPALKEYEYLRQYKNTMMYWDGEHWQNHPVANKWYQEALGRGTRH